MQFLTRVLILASSLFLSSSVPDYPFRNTSLPWSKRVDDLVSRLTLDEIKDQMSRGGAGPRGGPAPPIKRLGIGPYQWNTECLRGDVVAGEATSFPQALGLAASFSTDLVYRVAEATSIEVRAKHNDYVNHGLYGDHKGLSCFSPVINIMRDPRWGRNQETYGEDPVLTGVIATYFVKGLQGNHTRYIRANAGCKHFDAYAGPENIPVSRLSFSAQVSQRDLRTTFLPAFRACVQAGTYSLMCSYNSINGVPACADGKILTDILRKEWGFTGYVVSDEGAIELIISAHHYLNNSVDTVAACVNAGCNLELSASDANPVYYSIVEAVSRGKLNESVVRDRVKPLFNTRMRLGEFDPPQMNPYSKLNLSVVQSQAHRELAVEAAMKSFVLLKNLNTFLPLKKQKYDTIAIVGPMANNSVQLFGDYMPDLDPKYTQAPLQGLSSLGTKVNFAAGCADNKCTHYVPNDIQKATARTDLVFVCLGTGQEIESEGNDRASLSLPGKQGTLLQDSVRYANGTPVILLLFNAGPLNVTWAAYSPGVTAIFELFLPAQATGEALRRVLKNEGPGASPGGRLPFTWPKYESQIPPITNYSMQGRTYRYWDGEVLWPFGFGISYAQFVYVAMVFPFEIKAGQDAKGHISVENQGKFDADEVVQVYISWDNASVPVPKLQLVDFVRQSVRTHEFIHFNITVPAERMAVWVEDKGWVIEEGVITYYAGRQQPNVKTSVPYQGFSGTMKIIGHKVLGKY